MPTTVITGDLPPRGGAIEGTFSRGPSGSSAELNWKLLVADNEIQGNGQEPGLRIVSLLNASEINMEGIGNILAVRDCLNAIVAEAQRRGIVTSIS